MTEAETVEKEETPVEAVQEEVTLETLQLQRALLTEQGRRLQAEFQLNQIQVGTINEAIKTKEAGE